MTKNQPKVLVTTSDPYLWALRPFAYLLNKYWKPNPTVIVGGFTPPLFQLPRNFHFHSIGPFDKFPVDRWSDALRRFVLHYQHDIFVLMLEDYWIVDEVNDRAIRMLYDYMLQFEYVIRMDLTADRQFAKGAEPYEMCGDLQLIWSDPDSQYHMSLMTALWRRKHLFKVLRPAETPWEIELEGTSRLREYRDELIVLGTEICPIKHTLALRGGDPGRVLLDDLKPEDVAFIREQGWLERKDG